MNIYNTQFQDWKGNKYHFETSADMVIETENKKFFSPDVLNDLDDRYYTKTQTDEKLEDLKQYVVDGKDKVANAINGKTNDNQMSKDNTFDELATGITNIKTNNGGDYDPYLYLCSLLDDSEYSGEYRPYNHVIDYTNKVPELQNYRSGIYIPTLGMEAGDGRIYSQWTCQNEIYYMQNGETYPNSGLASGFVPPPSVDTRTNLFYMKNGQYLFCAVGTNKNDNIINFVEDKFIKMSTDSQGQYDGKLVPLMSPKQERIRMMEKSTFTSSWVPSSVKATIMVYQCQGGALDIRTYFKNYYAGTYILVPTYIYRKDVKIYDFPNKI